MNTPHLPTSRSSASGWRGAVLVALGLLSLGLLSPAEARAHEVFASLVPNPLMAMNTEGRIRPCITCHNNPDGGAGCGMMPCLNPFGMAFRANMFRWTPALAMMDSDGDGFTNGQELQDAMGAWTEGTYPGVASLATPPGNPAVTPGDTDGDMDRYCAFGRDLNMDGDCRDAGENEGSFDCNQMAAAIHSGATEVCSNVLDDDCDGSPTLTDSECAMVVDRDGDGRCVMGTDNNMDRNCAGAGESSATVVDCDDTRANVYAGARENCADTVDNDCDGDIDLADGQCQGDSDIDGDGYCPVGIDMNRDGDCVDSGEVITTIGDCDDENAAINPLATENTSLLCGDGLDNECDGTADLNDAQCLPFVDEDFDGYCPMGTDVDGDGDCTGPTDLSAGRDCDDANPMRSPGLLEICTDTARVDEDCDGVANLSDVGADGRLESTCLGYMDRDRDGYCFVGPDRNLDGDCLDSGEFGFSSDCDETSAVAAAVNPTATEVCTDTIDNDCDGSTDPSDPACAAYRDRDHDTFCEVGLDLNVDGDCADMDEQTGAVDMAPDDPTIYPDAPENCLDRRDNDQDGLVDMMDPQCTRDMDGDGDGYCALGQDNNMDGDCLDADENATISDCNDGDAEIGPEAEETCRNFRDDDCDVDVDLFDADCFFLLDRDRDGFCGMGVDDNRDGDCVDEAEDRFGLDCDDRNDAVNPNRAEVCDNMLDDDCDGALDMRDSSCACMPDCDDDDPCTVDVCRADGRGCEHTRAPMCIDSGPPMDAGADAGVASSGGCSAGRSSGAPPAGLLALVLGLFIGAGVRRRSRASTSQKGLSRAPSQALRSAFLVGAVVAFSWCAGVGRARAYSSYQDNVPNGTTIGCLTCHNNTGGGNPLGNGTCGSSPGSSPCWNSFASRFVFYGYAFPAGLRNEDSDGDGWTNGQELLWLSGTWVEGGANPGPTAEARTPGIAYSAGNCATWSRACAMNECTLNYDDCDTSPVATCNELTPTFSCTCPAGYSGTGRGTSGCLNINECTAGNPCNEDTDPTDVMCVDDTPRYDCICGTGWAVQFNGTFSETCVDENECTLGNPCLEDTVPGNTCMNNTGRYDCTCGAAGYQILNNGTSSETCGDINECASGNPCNEDTFPVNSCSNLTPRYDCVCGAGFTLSNNGLFTETCADVNECMTMPGVCGVGACVNATGSYSCSCPSGYSFNGTTCVDINECSTMPGVCGLGSCTNSAGAYSCTCPGGYTFNGTTCVVNNACTANTDNCADAESAICTPIGMMAWSCSCPAGYTGNGVLRTSGGTGCTDNNECSASPCGVGACVNLPGTYSCTCPTGYSFNGTTCIDVNECTVTPFICGPGTCANTTGSYRCSCNPGYTAPATGGTCGDVDECLSTATCNAASGWGSCSNTVGAYSCSCNTGYAPSGSGLSLTCTNVNECSTAPPCGVGTCADTIGSYRCTCPVGYASPASGGTCSDVDECLDTSVCAVVMGYGNCVNDVGAFHCDCASGFVVSGSGRTQTCANVDECTAGTDDCDVNASCRDAVPAFGTQPFICTCNPGWEGPGNVCTDFDECGADATNDCSPLGTCMNEPGTYGCSCNEGYEGNGFVCVDTDECASDPCGANEVCFNQIGAPAVCECEAGFARPLGGGACTSSCGNGVRIVGEECDDGNTAPLDGCSATCDVEDGYVCYEDGAPSVCSYTCGDGVLDPLSGEECDEGVANDDTVPDACRERCVRAACGDGVVDMGEPCDDGRMNSDMAPDACRTDCREAFCGDGVLDADEYCDRGTGTELAEVECTAACLPDAGMPDAGTGAEPLPTNGACACRAPGASRGGTGVLALLGALGLVVAARRRRS